KTYRTSRRSAETAASPTRRATHCLEQRSVTMQIANTAAVEPKGYKGLGMEGFVAAWYARQTAKDMDEFRSAARRLGAHIKPDFCALEIAPGPGYLAIEVVKLTGCRMVGIDISKSFVSIADENALRAGLDIAFDQGDAAAMPYPANGFDFIFCRAAFKNFSRPLAAL